MPPFPEILTGAPAAADGVSALAICTTLLDSAGGDDPLLAILVGLVVTGFLIYRKFRK